MIHLTAAASGGHVSQAARSVDEALRIAGRYPFYEGSVVRVNGKKIGLFTMNTFQDRQKLRQALEKEITCRS